MIRFMSLLAEDVNLCFWRTNYNLFLIITYSNYTLIVRKGSQREPFFDFQMIDGNSVMVRHCRHIDCRSTFINGFY